MRMLMPVTWHDLKHWQKNFGFDRNGRTGEISYQLQDDVRLVLTVDGTTYDINLTEDIVPQIERIFENA